jgi:hypothetical protein
MDSNNATQNQQIPQNEQVSQPVASQPKPPVQNTPPPPQQPEDPQTGYEKLEEQYRKAIDLRLLHFPYQVISKKLIAASFKATEGTVRSWFSIGGACHDTYEAMVKIRRVDLDEQIKQQQDLIQQGTANALIIVNKVLQKAVENEEITEQEAIAARDMLDRGGVPKLSKVDSNNKIDAEGVAEMAAIIKGILEPKK